MPTETPEKEIHEMNLEEQRGYYQREAAFWRQRVIESGNRRVSESKKDYANIRRLTRLYRKFAVKLNSMSQLD